MAATCGRGHIVQLAIQHRRRCPEQFLPGLSFLPELLVAARLIVYHRKMLKFAS